MNRWEVKYLGRGSAARLCEGVIYFSGNSAPSMCRDSNLVTREVKKHPVSLCFGEKGWVAAVAQNLS